MGRNPMYSEGVSVCQYCNGRGCHYCGTPSMPVDQEATRFTEIPAICAKCSVYDVCRMEIKDTCMAFREANR